MKHDISRMCWWMRGSVSISEAYMLGPDDREAIYAVIKENVETAKKTQQPFW